MFLNGRAIRDRALGHALAEAYRGMLLSGRYPICLLQVVIPPELVDVNVHPTKLEVRFQDSGRLYSQLLGTLRTKFLTVDLTSKLQSATAADEAAAAHDRHAAQHMRQQVVTWAKGELPRPPKADPSGETPTGLVKATDDDAVRGGAFSDEVIESPRRGAPLELVRIDRSAPTAWSTHPYGAAGIRSATSAQVARASEVQSPAAQVEQSNRASFDAAPNAFRPQPTWQPLETPDRPFPSDNLRPTAIQVHNRYLIAETDEGMVVIDHHALHERILYEQIREKVLAGAMESQRLLVPEPVDLGPAESAAVLSATETLARLGVNVEPFGGGTVLITGYPAMLANFRPVEVLRELVDKLLSEGRSPDRRDLLDDLLHMISCKAAIKAGDRLSQEEIAALVEQRHRFADSHHCPHGRPTSLLFTREDLDRQFMRT
jgi:DNA mismatch repair protein MutL